MPKVMDEPKVTWFNILLLLVMIFNAGGVRIVDNYVLTLATLFLLAIQIIVKETFHLRYALIASVTVILFLAAHYFLTSRGLPIKHYIIYFSYLLTAIAIVAAYKGGNGIFQLDIYAALKFILAHALLGAVLQLIMEPSFDLNLDRAHILYVFYYDQAKDISFMFRNAGFFWEPGVLQIFLNILLYMSLFIYRQKVIAALCCMAIISTISTAGYLVMAMLVFFWVVQQLRSFTLAAPTYLIVMLLIIALSGFSLMNKLYGERHKSADVRQFDMVVGFSVIKDHPILGIGMSSERLLDIYHEIGKEHQKDFSITEHELENKGTTNGILYLATALGLPWLLLWIFLALRQNIFPHRWLVLLMLLMFCSSEPIIQTAFFSLFWAFGLYAVMFRKDSQHDDGISNERLCKNENQGDCSLGNSR
ncbi:MAG: O-antigen ligase family protein [Mariprofundaceae bacterium]|nr:O-antigen ligase family protein [Mariprofundaceae bacterium]